MKPLINTAIRLRSALENKFSPFFRGVIILKPIQTKRPKRLPNIIAEKHTKEEVRRFLQHIPKEPTVRCRVRSVRFMGGIIELAVIDKTKEVWSHSDGDGIWGTTFANRKEAVKVLGKKVVEKYLRTREEIDVDVPESFWTDVKGYIIRSNRSYVEGKPETVDVPLTLNSTTNIACPYCGYPKEVESDARGKVTCEGCGKPYNITNEL